MKVRDQVLWRAVLAVAYAAAALPIAGGVLAMLEWLSWGRSGFVPLVVFLIVFPVPFVTLMLRARCPRCHYPFQTIGFLRLKWGARRRRIDYCPHCRLSLDSDANRVEPAG